MTLNKETEEKFRKLLTISSRAFSLMLPDLEKNRHLIHTYKDVISSLNLIEELKKEINKTEKPVTYKFKQASLWD